MIKRKEADESRHGIYCPMRETDGRCIGQACAWWVDDDERRGHCAALDWGRRGKVTAGAYSCPAD